MITLQMEELANGKSRPVALIIDAEHYIYDDSTSQKYFQLLEKYINYKIKVEWYKNHQFIKKENCLIKEVKQNLEGNYDIKLEKGF